MRPIAERELLLLLSLLGSDEALDEDEGDDEEIDGESVIESDDTDNDDTDAAVDDASARSGSRICMVWLDFHTYDFIHCNIV